MGEHDQFNSIEKKKTPEELLQERTQTISQERQRTMEDYLQLEDHQDMETEQSYDALIRQSDWEENLAMQGQVMQTLPPARALISAPGSPNQFTAMPQRSSKQIKEDKKDLAEAKKRNPFATEVSLRMERECTKSDEEGERWAKERTKVMSQLQGGGKVDPDVCHALSIHFSKVSKLELSEDMLSEDYIRKNITQLRGDKEAFDLAVQAAKYQNQKDANGDPDAAKREPTAEEILKAKKQISREARAQSGNTQSGDGKEDVNEEEEKKADQLELASIKRSRAFFAALDGACKTMQFDLSSGKVIESKEKDFDLREQQKMDFAQQRKEFQQSAKDLERQLVNHIDIQSTVLNQSAVDSFKDKNLSKFAKEDGSFDRHSELYAKLYGDLYESEQLVRDLRKLRDAYIPQINSPNECLSALAQQYCRKLDARIEVAEKMLKKRSALVTSVVDEQKLERGESLSEYTQNVDLTTISPDDTPEMVDVKQGLIAVSNCIEANLNEKMTPELIKTLRERYMAAIANCSYYEEHRNPYTKRGKARKKMVQDARVGLEIESNKMLFLQKSLSALTLGEYMGIKPQASASEDASDEKGESVQKEESAKKDAPVQEQRPKWEQKIMDRQNAQTKQARSILTMDLNARKQLASGDKKVISDYMSLHNILRSIPENKEWARTFDVNGARVRLMQKADNSLYLLQGSEMVPLEQNAKLLVHGMEEHVLANAKLYGKEAVQKVMDDLSAGLTSKSVASSAGMTMTRNLLERFLVGRIPGAATGLANLSTEYLMRTASRFTSAMDAPEKEATRLEAECTQDLMAQIEKAQLDEKKVNTEEQLELLRQRDEKELKEKVVYLEPQKKEQKDEQKDEGETWENDEKAVLDMFSDILYSSETWTNDETRTKPGERLGKMLIKHSSAIQTLLDSIQKTQKARENAINEQKKANLNDPTTLEGMIEEMEPKLQEKKRIADKEYEEAVREERGCKHAYDVLMALNWPDNPVLKEAEEACSAAQNTRLLKASNAKKADDDLKMYSAQARKEIKDALVKAQEKADAAKLTEEEEKQAAEAKAAWGTGFMANMNLAIAKKNNPLAIKKEAQDALKEQLAKETEKLNGELPDEERATIETAISALKEKIEKGKLTEEEEALALTQKEALDKARLQFGKPAILEKKEKHDALTKAVAQQKQRWTELGESFGARKDTQELQDKSITKEQREQIDQKHRSVWDRIIAKLPREMVESMGGGSGLTDLPSKFMESALMKMVLNSVGAGAVGFAMPFIVTTFSKEIAEAETNLDEQIHDMMEQVQKGINEQTERFFNGDGGEEQEASKQEAPKQEKKGEKKEDKDPDAKLDAIMEESMKGSTGEAAFQKEIIRSYFGESKAFDQRAMLASALRNMKPVPKEKQGTEEGTQEFMGNFLGGLFKGAGPLMQKTLQGLPTQNMPKGLQKAVEDMKSKLSPIPKEIVDAQLMAMVNRSEKAVDRIEVVKSLGAASVGQTFLCKMYGPNLSKEGEEVVVKLLRPDALTKMAHEEKIMMECAERVPGQAKTFAGKLKKIREELDLRIEADNCITGELYDGKFDNISAMKLHPLIQPTANSMVLQKAGDTDLSKYIESVSEKIEEAEKLANDPNGLDLTNVERVRALLEELNAELTSLGKREELLSKAAEEWVEEGIFKSGYFHGDLHAGNIMITDEKLTLIDFGNVTKLTDKQQKLITSMMMAASEQDAETYLRGYHDLMDTDDQEVEATFQKQKGNLLAEFKKIMAEGNQGSAGKRIAASLMRAQDFGVPLPATVANFSHGQMRLQNAMSSMTERRKAVDGVITKLAKKLEEASVGGLTGSSVEPFLTKSVAQFHFQINTLDNIMNMSEQEFADTLKNCDDHMELEDYMGTMASVDTKLTRFYEEMADLEKKLDNNQSLPADMKQIEIPDALRTQKTTSQNITKDQEEAKEKLNALNEFEEYDSLLEIEERVIEKGDGADQISEEESVALARLKDLRTKADLAEIKQMEKLQDEVRKLEKKINEDKKKAKVEKDAEKKQEIENQSKEDQGTLREKQKRLYWFKHLEPLQKQLLEKEKRELEEKMAEYSTYLIGEFQASKKTLAALEKKEGVTQEELDKARETVNQYERVVKLDQNRDKLKEYEAKRAAGKLSEKDENAYQELKGASTLELTGMNNASMGILERCAAIEDYKQAQSEKKLRMAKKLDSKDAAAGLALRKLEHGRVCFYGEWRSRQRTLDELGKRKPKDNTDRETLSEEKETHEFYCKNLEENNPKIKRYAAQLETLAELRKIEPKNRTPQQKEQIERLEYRERICQYSEDVNINGNSTSMPYWESGKFDDLPQGEQEALHGAYVELKGAANALTLGNRDLAKWKEFLKMNPEGTKELQCPEGVDGEGFTTYRNMLPLHRLNAQREELLKAQERVNKLWNSKDDSEESREESKKTFKEFMGRLRAAMNTLLGEKNIELALASGSLNRIGEEIAHKEQSKSKKGEKADESKPDGVDEFKSEGYKEKCEAFARLYKEFVKENYERLRGEIEQKMSHYNTDVCDYLEQMLEGSKEDVMQRMERIFKTSPEQLKAAKEQLDKYYDAVKNKPSLSGKRKITLVSHLSKCIQETKRDQKAFAEAQVEKQKQANNDYSASSFLDVMSNVIEENKWNAAKNLGFIATAKFGYKLAKEAIKEKVKGVFSKSK